MIGETLTAMASAIQKTPSRSIRAQHLTGIEILFQIISIRMIIMMVLRITPQMESMLMRMIMI